MYKCKHKCKYRRINETKTYKKGNSVKKLPYQVCLTRIISSFQLQE